MPTAVGCGFGFGDGFGVGLRVVVGVAFGVALGVGFGVALGVGFGVGGAVGGGAFATVIALGVTAVNVVVISPFPVPLVALKLYVQVPTGSARLVLYVTVPPEPDPAGLIPKVPTPPTMSETDGVQPALSK